ncbi:hypothetical protein [Ralstonia phage RP31]|uniref:Transmembrane protein n=2 Tax=Ripduovirus RP12 TaxID=2560700 RepID=A0A1L7N136_9CAUD|nr:hypothetical protein FDH28_gp205 [Ralstonia phage RP12]BAW19190.1 hypothetical protein [Ralstonia phage RP12]BAW19476.1 hypothetical protein [Ralstonia phage RP31]
MGVFDDPCKPGGCSKIGCEGGHYCYNPDGTKREAKPLDEAQLAGLKLLKRLNSYDHTSPPSDVAKERAEAAMASAEQRFARNIKRSFTFERTMKIGLILTVVTVVAAPFVYWYCLH